MTSFIRSVEETARSSVENVWEKPTDEVGATKQRCKWTEEELKLSGMNQMTLNVIQSAMNVESLLLSLLLKLLKRHGRFLNNNEGNKTVKNKRLH